MQSGQITPSIKTDLCQTVDTHQAPTSIRHRAAAAFKAHNLPIAQHAMLKSP